MKKRHGFYGVVLAGMILCALPVQAAGEDTSWMPTVEGTISATQLKKGDTLTYSFRTHIVGLKCIAYANAKMVHVVWKSPSGQSVEDCLPVSKTAHYNGELKIEEGMQAGTWRISEIQFLTDDFVPGYSFSPQKQWYWCSVKDKAMDSLDFSFSEFTVSGTKADQKSPVIQRKSIKINKKSISKNGKAKISLKVKDQSALRYVVCGWKKSNSESIVYEILKKRKGQYEAAISGSAIGKKGTLRLMTVVACDRYGNKKVMKKFPNMTISVTK